MAKELEELAKYYQSYANAFSSLSNASGMIAEYLGALGIIGISTGEGSFFFWG
jgi:hypothetical protein